MGNTNSNNNTFYLQCAFTSAQRRIAIEKQQSRNLVDIWIKATETLHTVH